MAGLNPDILTWARETAGFDRDAAAVGLGLKAVKGVSGATRLAAIEAGDAPPTGPQLERMAKLYRRPLITFYLEEVPRPADVGHDFRTLPDEAGAQSPLLATLLRDVTARQALVRAAIEEDDDAPRPRVAVGSVSARVPVAKMAAAIEQTIGFDRAAFRGARSVDDAFAYLRSKVEAAGAFVLLAGDCGSYKTVIDVASFRGFAIADPVAPFIVINDQDARSAWSFTLLHEFAHLLLGATGVSGGQIAAGVERLCNDAAAATLVAQDELGDFGATTTEASVAAINDLATRFRVSRTMIAYQLFAGRKIDGRRWEELSGQYRAEWQAEKAAGRERARSQGSKPSYYVVRRHRFGPALLNLARQGLAEGSLTPTRAARMLGVKPTSVYPLLAEQEQRRKG